MIYDLITLLIAAVFIIVGAVRGAAKTLLGLLDTLVSFIAAVFLGKLISDWIYISFIKNAVIDSVSNAVNNAAGGAASNAVDALPVFLKSLLAVSGESFDNTVAATASQAANAVEQALGPIVIALMSFVLTIVLFFILALLLKLIVVRPLSKMSESSPLRGINRFFGGILGLLEAMLTICVLAYLLRLLLPALHPDSYFFSESTIYNSYIFYHFYSGNIFSAIISVF